MHATQMCQSMGSFHTCLYYFYHLQVTGIVALNFSIFIFSCHVHSHFSTIAHYQQFNSALKTCISLKYCGPYKFKKCFRFESFTELAMAIISLYFLLRQHYMTIYLHGPPYTHSCQHKFPGTTRILELKDISIPAIVPFPGTANDLALPHSKTYLYKYLSQTCLCYNIFSYKLSQILQ